MSRYSGIIKDCLEIAEGSGDLNTTIKFMELLQLNRIADSLESISQEVNVLTKTALQRRKAELLKRKAELLRNQEKSEQ